MQEARDNVSILNVQGAVHVTLVEELACSVQY
jgi:hypothetical protein